MLETPLELPGGNVNSRVVRIGNTVRRSTTPASPAVHQLLLHLEKKGFTGCPRFLGLDEQGRETLTFLKGETGIPTFIWQRNEPLLAVARLLRQYHDATVDFKQPASARWAYSYPDHKQHEVICHNDFAPYNLIYASGIPYAVIDFDLAGPGPRLRDIAYAAYWMVPMSFNSQDQKEFALADLEQGSRRCRLFCETYGIQADREFLDMIAHVLAFMSSEAEMRQIVGSAAAEKLKKEGHLDHWQSESRSFQSFRSRLKENLLY